MAVVPGAAVAIEQVIAPGLLGLGTLSIVYAALRTRDGAAHPRKRALWRALAITAALVACTRLIVFGLPNGLRVLVEWLSRLCAAGFSFLVFGVRGPDEGMVTMALAPVEDGTSP